VRDVEAIALVRPAPGQLNDVGDLDVPVETTREEGGQTCVGVLRGEPWPIFAALVPALQPFVENGLQVRLQSALAVIHGRTGPVHGHA
jgi:hypothetical protein